MKINHFKSIIKAAKRLFGITKKQTYNEMMSDRDTILEQIRQKGYLLPYVSNELKNDKIFMLEAIKINEVALCFASDKLKNDKEFYYSLVENLGTKYVEEAMNKAQINKELLELDSKSLESAQASYDCKSGKGTYSFAKLIEDQDKNNNISFNFK
jgi:hypothetical protein